VARASRSAKAESKDRIVQEAARLFRAGGIGSTAVADVMSAAGLTHGGFYRHFGSKDELAAEAIEKAVADYAQPLEQAIKLHGPKKSITRYVNQYLSEEHVAMIAGGCPLAALGGELARGPRACKQAYACGAQRVIDLLGRGWEGGGEAARAQATTLLALMVGAVVLARVVDSSQHRQRILSAARTQARELLRGPEGRSATGRRSAPS
jgi:TetR/AcrR family transcriptional repressor of nem operon